ncbi:ATP-binding protein [Alcanivorax jadensis]|uniref:ATP-binding protein n=1 Tax=Alcanivorax jadensis TaxID=64988 RepID=UPI002356415A|nr:ATP-binding protein [Alcanivorax jadensis]|tara:strand:+ start:1867 stop:2664 length:798 start_codon:yes stop_codon:yes gene_type:complete
MESLFGSSQSAGMKHCDKHGEYEAKSAEFMGKRVVTGCPDCAIDSAAQRDREFQQELVDNARQARQRQSERVMRKAGIPERFRSKTFADFQPHGDAMMEVHRLCQVYAERFDDLAQKGTSMIFSGPSGTGKTHLACAIGARVMEDGRVFMFTNAYDLLMAVKDTYDKDSDERESGMIRGFVKPDLLVVDEVDVGLASESDKRIMFAILNGRYEQMRPTIVMSNLPTEGDSKKLQDVLGARMFDRLLEGKGKILHFQGRSQRTSGN